MNTSWNGIKFICAREALVTAAYRDGGTDEHPKYSIGFGSQIPPVQPGDTISIEEAFSRMKEHIARNDVTIGRLLNAVVTQSVWDALASLYYQAGSLALRSVTVKVHHGPIELMVLDFANWGFKSP